MTMPLNAPQGAYNDDPVANLDPVADERDTHFAMASYGVTRIKEWAARGDTKQRALRDDLVTLCLCPKLLPCKKPSAAWVGRQHGVSREYASRLCRESGLPHLVEGSPDKTNLLQLSKLFRA